MNILYITALPGLISAGPSWSIPAGIKAQSKIDNCLWVNVSDGHLDHWNDVECYHNIKDFAAKFKLTSLPIPFDKPDLVVFEDFYEIQPPLIAKQLRKEGIPYIIVPRGALTKKAQNNQSKWKKKIANALLFKKYVRNALAIQFLTSDEKKDSGEEWNKSSFILPNGFSTPSVFKNGFHKDSIKAIFIGRLDVFHKGLDVLLKACENMADDLRDANFTLCIYGPKNGDYDVIVSEIRQLGISDIVTMGGEISGKAKESALLESDLFVLTSRFEGHPMGLVEALAYGVPVLVTPGTNMSEEIIEADAGWVCRDANEEDIRVQLQRMIQEHCRLGQKSKNAVRLAKKYDWDVLASRFHSEVGNLIHKR